MKGIEIHQFQSEKNVHRTLFIQNSTKYFDFSIIFLEEWDLSNVCPIHEICSISRYTKVKTFPTLLQTSVTVSEQIRQRHPLPRLFLLYVTYCLLLIPDSQFCLSRDTSVSTTRYHQLNGYWFIHNPTIFKAPD